MIRRTLNSSYGKNHFQGLWFKYWQSFQERLSTHVLSVRRCLPYPGISTFTCAPTVVRNPMSVLSARKGLLVSIHLNNFIVRGFCDGTERVCIRPCILELFTVLYLAMDTAIWCLVCRCMMVSYTIVCYILLRVPVERYCFFKSRSPEVILGTNIWTLWTRLTVGLRIIETFNSHG